MKEREFQGWIVDVAEAHGWHVWHAPTPMRPIGGNKFVPDPRGRGLPDLFLLHDDPPRLILAEVKNEDGVMGDAQIEFLKLARAVAVEARRQCYDLPVTDRGEPTVGVFVWRPAHRDLIEAILKGASV